MAIGSTGIVIDPRGKVSMRTGLHGRLGTAFLERRIVDEVSNVIESILHGVQEAARNRIPVREIDAILSRAMLAFHRKHYDAALKLALEAQAILTEKMRTPPPPPVAVAPPVPAREARQ